MQEIRSMLGIPPERQSTSSAELTPKSFGQDEKTHSIAQVILSNVQAAMQSLRSTVSEHPIKTTLMSFGTGWVGVGLVATLSPYVVQISKTVWEGLELGSIGGSFFAFSHPKTEDDELIFDQKSCTFTKGKVN